MEQVNVTKGLPFTRQSSLKTDKRQCAFRGLYGGDHNNHKLLNPCEKETV